MTTLLELSDVEKRYDNGTLALERVNLKVGQHEFVSLLGPSGCGKSTLLNLIGGLTQVTTGVIKLDGREVNAPGPDRAIVFQNHSLLPWLSVYDNVKMGVQKVFAGTKTKA